MRRGRPVKVLLRLYDEVPISSAETRFDILAIKLRLHLKLEKNRAKHVHFEFVRILICDGQVCRQTKANSRHEKQGIWQHKGGLVAREEGECTPSHIRMS